MWYHATDRHGGKILTDPALKSKLEDLHSGQTKHRLGKLPLVIGMPVLLSHNYDVEGEIVNESAGILRTIHYPTDSNGDRHLVSCVVEVPDSAEEPLPHLPLHYVPILQDTVDL
ncbi:hypothetical protein BKA93DRAFT_727720, partial [Sparassis latifolia]